MSDKINQKAHLAESVDNNVVGNLVVALERMSYYGRQCMSPANVPGYKRNTSGAGVPHPRRRVGLKFGPIFYNRICCRYICQARGRDARPNNVFLATKHTGVHCDDQRVTGTDVARPIDVSSGSWRGVKSEEGISKHIGSIERNERGGGIGDVIVHQERFALSH